LDDDDDDYDDNNNNNNNNNNKSNLAIYTILRPKTCIMYKKGKNDWLRNQSLTRKNIKCDKH
jgi:hypothetical protein